PGVSADTSQKRPATRDCQKEQATIDITMEWLRAEPAKGAGMRARRLDEPVKPWREQCRTQKDHDQVEQQKAQWPHGTKTKITKPGCQVQRRASPREARKNR